MAEPLVDTAEAIVTDVNAATFAVSFAAELSYAEWDVKLTDLDTLHVDVVPAGYISNTLDDRGGFLRWEVAVHIGVRKRLRIDGTSKRYDPAEVKELIGLTRALSDYFANDGSGGPHELSTYSQATWIADAEKNNRSEILETCDKKMLRVNAQYTGVVQVLYEIGDSPQ